MEIVQADDALEPPDAEAVLAWCLDHEHAVADSIRRGGEEAEAVRWKIEARQGSEAALRERTF